MNQSSAVDVDRAIVEGVLREQRDGMIFLALAGTDYVLHLKVDQPIDAPAGTKIHGRIHASARRMDVIKSGGRYIEPVEGPPRRIQGRVIAVDEVNDAVTVLASAPIICSTDPLQKAGMFVVGAMVSFGVEPGAKFDPVD
jgi:hypothetical protein